MIREQETVLFKGRHTTVSQGFTLCYSARVPISETVWMLHIQVERAYCSPVTLQFCVREPVGGARTVDDNSHCNLYFYGPAHEMFVFHLVDHGPGIITLRPVVRKRKA